MKTIALILTLALHTTGLWSHLPASSRDRLTAAGSTISNPSPPATTPPAAAVAPLPVQVGSERLKLAAGSALAVDVSTGTTLYANNVGAKRPIASITKLVTTLVVLSHHDPSERVRVAQLPDYTPEDELVGLIPGETYTIGDLVRATLIHSGNDAADALALADAGSITKFAAKMNTLMAAWGIPDTHFTNATGLIDTGNYATAQALVKIGNLSLSNAFIRQTITHDGGTITSTAGRTLTLTATNELLAGGQFYGIKTGYTLAAGECFVGLARIQGHDVITVILGSDNRFGTTQQLTNWIERNWQWL